MRKKLTSACLFLFLLLPMAVFADEVNEQETLSETTTSVDKPFDEELPGGFLTTPLNNYLEKKVDAQQPADEAKPVLGRKLKDYVSAPVFGAYVIGKYGYTSNPAVSPNNTFEARMIRAYVSGFILKEFKYRVQLELKSPAMRDFTLEWLRFKGFQIKVGQFKRCFTYENPMNPWDVGFGGYSQVAMYMTALGKDDPSGETSQNGRDLGLQFQGDLFPVGRDKHRLVRYQAAIFNGNGQNKSDNNSQKDFIGNIQLQPIRGLYIGLFGWTGSYTGANGIRVNRNRWELGATFDRNDWTARAEYVHHTGYSWKNYDAATKTFKGSNKADGWYLALGVPCTKWLKVWAKYDAYRQDATWSTLRTVYSVAPNIHLHSNLLFQLQYNYVHDRTASLRRDYHELWAEFYVRF